MAQHPLKGGGRMPIVTGFLRASIQAALGRMPEGPTKNEGNKTYAIGQQVAGAPVSTVLLKWDPNKGEPLFIGWTAVYARAMEARYGYLRGATEKWDITVAKAAKQAGAGFG